MLLRSTFVRVLSIAFLSALPCFASSIDFKASGTFDDGSLLGGTLTIDTTAGTITASNLTVTGASNFTFVNIVNQSNTQVLGDYNAGDRNAAGTEDFDFDLPVTTLVGYSGGKICSTQSSCLHGSRYAGIVGLTAGGGYSNLLNGKLVAPTPEPSSLVLLGTGALAVTGAARRKFRRG